MRPGQGGSPISRTPRVPGRPFQGDFPGTVYCKSTTPALLDPCSSECHAPFKGALWPDGWGDTGVKQDSVGLSGKHRVAFHILTGPCDLFLCDISWRPAEHSGSHCFRECEPCSPAFTLPDVW